MQLWIRLRRLATPLRRREEWVSLAVWVVAVALLETAGPHSPSDAIDGLLLAGLIALAMATLRAHATHRLRWVGVVRRSLRSCGGLLRRFDTELGVDFRRTPRLRRGTPPPVLIATLLAASLLGGATLAAPLLPEGLRVLSQHAFVPYLVVLGALWIALGMGIVMGVMMPIVALHDRLAGVLEPGARRKRVALLSAATIGPVLLVALLVPAGYAAWGAATIFLITSATVALCPVRYELLWLDKAGERRSMTWRRYTGLGSLVLTCFALLPLMVGLGDQWLGDGFDATSLPMTRILARAFAWSCLILSGTLLVQLYGFIQRAVLFERARRSRPTARLVGEVTPEDEDVVRGMGWQLAGDDARAGEVRVTFAEDAAPSDPLFGPTLPAQVPPGWLTEPDSPRRLARKRVQDLRRRVVRGVARAMKAVSGRKFEQGTGFWVTPHLWFSKGLTRDSCEGQSVDGDPIIEERLGLPWERRMTWEARAYLCEVLTALQIDLIFVEDGVGARRFTQLLRTLFEVVDTHGARPLEERQVSLVPGVRVLIQDDAGLERPLGRKGFPEPDYSDLGRARLLLVFRDRGGHAEREETPQDVRDRPLVLAPV